MRKKCFLSFFLLFGLTLFSQINPLIEHFAFGKFQDGKDFIGETAAIINADSKGNIYIFDLKDKVINKFDSSGNFLLKIGLDLNSHLPCGFSIDWNDNIYMLDCLEQSVFVYDSTGNLKETFSVKDQNYKWLQIEITEDKIFLLGSMIKQGQRYEAIAQFDRNSKEITIVFNKERGKYNQNEATPFRPHLKSAFYKDLIIIGFSDAYEIYILKNGKSINKIITRSFTPQPLEQWEIDAIWHELYSRAETDQDRTRLTEFKIKLMFPKFKPAFQSFFFDERGNLYVLTYEVNKNRERKIDLFDKDFNYKFSFFSSLFSPSLRFKNGYAYNIVRGLKEKPSLAIRYKVLENF